jgi:hypothetical protein
MKFLFDADWDDDAKVWYAVSRDDIGLVTEAATLDSLRARVAVILPELIELDAGQEAEFDLVVHSAIQHAGPIAAE